MTDTVVASVTPNILSPAVSASSQAEQDALDFTPNLPERPMLSRDAENVYWMSRYTERAEHVARVLLVNSNFLMDIGDLAPQHLERQWQSLLRIFRLDETLPVGTPGQSFRQRVGHFMAFSAENPNSLVNCLSRARDNARAIRENISAEMWEATNKLYWFIRAEDAPAKFEEAPDEFCREIMNGSMLFQGLTDQTMAHDQRWAFTQLGKYFERVDVTCRVIDTKIHTLRGFDSSLETPLRNTHWMTVLRCCCSIEHYRRNHFDNLGPIPIASFLLLKNSFPRSVRLSVQNAHLAIAQIRAETAPHEIDPAERVLGRLEAQLEFAETAELVRMGIPNYLAHVQQLIMEASIAIQQRYFLH